MAFETKVYYGFKVSNNLSDVINKSQALRVLTLEIGDIDIIRGVRSGNDNGASATRFDFQAMSRLKEDVYKTIDRYQGDTGQYEGILRASPGADISLRGNLNVNGGIGGSAIRYRALNDTNSAINFLDISTSRVSAWSTTTNPPADADPIYYGGEVKVLTGGKLIVDNMTFGTAALPKLFNAEVPTHKVRITIDGSDYDMYAMKSIPLKFRGFFRRFDWSSVFTSYDGSLKASWRIVNVNNSSDIQSYADRGTNTSSSLSYRSVRSAERDVEFYYPPDNITSFSATSAGIRELPAASLPNLSTLNLFNNEILTMPDLNAFSPNLVSLNISRNAMYQSDDEAYRKLNAAVVKRIPSTVTSLTLYGNFYGGIRTTTTNTPSGVNDSGTPGSSPSVIEARFPNLTQLYIGRGGGAYFSPDDYDTASYLPTVPASLEVFHAYSNDFRAIPSTGLVDRANLTNFHVSGNTRLSDSNWETSSFSNADDLNYLNFASTQLKLPSLQNKTNLATIYGHYSSGGEFYTNNTNESTYKLENCSSLSTLVMYRSGLNGFIPKFKGNTSLNYVHLWVCQSLTGGRPDNGSHGYADGQTYVMYQDTFDDCRDTLGYFYYLSASALYEKGFEDGTWSNLSNLRHLYWYSYRRTGGSRNDINVPDLSSLPSLQVLYMPVNNFSGSAPSLVSNNDIRYMNLAYNKLTGAVPEYANRLRMYYIGLYNNNLTSFPGMDSMPSLYYLFLHNNNSLTGPVPDISGPAPGIGYLYLFNCNFTSYTRGSFANFTRIRRILLQNNSFTTTDIDRMFIDFENIYDSTGNSRVQVNLRGQPQAYAPRTVDQGADEGSAEAETARILAKLRAAGWSISL